MVSVTRGCWLQSCPCDGRVLYQGEVTNGLLEQVKGISYCLSSFFGPLYDLDRASSSSQSGDDALNCALAGGDGRPCVADISETQYMDRLLRRPQHHRLFYCTIYLSPGDYHRFHSPASWTAVERRYFPGSTPPRSHLLCADTVSAVGARTDCANLVGLLESWWATWRQTVRKVKIVNVWYRFIVGSRT